MDERERASKDELTGVENRNSDTGQQRASGTASDETTVEFR
jgi:hypothetical protein